MRPRGYNRGLMRGLIGLFTIGSFTIIDPYSVVYGGEWIDIDRMVYAIGKAENSKRFPYGIKSIDTKGNVEYAKKLCRQSVVNNLKRWDKAGNPGSFIAFMGSRYAPTIGASDDPTGLNNNWVKNVSYFYNKGGNT